MSDSVAHLEFPTRGDVMGGRIMGLRSDEKIRAGDRSMLVDESQGQRSMQ
jgi:hypothetical protein